jgi:ADP-ribose pyrophosphatase YjhB (NUDIX family)
VSRPDGVHEYALPGGHIEDGETALQAVGREVAEETGVQILSAGRLHVGTQDGTLVHVFVARTMAGAAAPLERDGRGGGEVGYLTWPALKAQARQFRAFLAGIEKSFRMTYGEMP